MTHTPTILNEFISRIEVHERDQKRARYAIQHISIYFNYIGKFENEVTQLARSAGATEALKATDPMKWVGLMNACRAQAEEIAKFELVYV